MGMALKALPVPNALLPARTEKNGRHHIATCRMFVTQSSEPSRASDPRREQVPQEPELWRIRLAIFHRREARDDPIDLPWVAINRIKDGAQHGFSGRLRRPH